MRISMETLQNGRYILLSTGIIQTISEKADYSTEPGYSKNDYFVGACYTSESQLFWECNEATWSESWPGPESLGTRSHSRLKENLVRHVKNKWETGIGEVYSDTLLTKQDDVFPAISGMSRTHCESMGMQTSSYIAVCGVMT